ncbi:MAG: hypothetical protein NVV68_01035 [Dokdonella sp.]|nr:hypothetical protein [Dokdonella sp.]
MSSQRPGLSSCSKVPQTQLAFCRLLTCSETTAYSTPPDIAV